MLTKKQNMLEVIRGGNPDRFVKQYEAIQFILNTPYALQYPMMPEGPGAPAVKCGWGIPMHGRLELLVHFRCTMQNIWFARISQNGKNM